jgi:hypothetical protein
MERTRAYKWMAGPFNREVSQILRLQNPHSDPVAFKVRITPFKGPWNAMVE